MVFEPPKELGRSSVGAGLVLAGLFIAERVVLGFAGVRFNVDALDWYWQVLDPVVLKESLSQSLFFLHSQPPLFNLVLGLALKVCPAGAPLVLHGLFSALGLVLALVLFTGLLEFEWPPRIAALAVAVAALTPGWIVYEYWLFYDFPVVVLLAVACVALLRYSRRGQWGSLCIFMMGVSAVALTRSLFHLVWVVGTVAIVVWIRPRLTGFRAIAVLGIPLLLVVGWYAKNQAVFGFFGPSSWLGLSLAKTATARLDPGDREALVSAGVLSSWADVKPFSPLESYESAAGIHFEDSQVKALGQRLKASGSPNFNHLAFVEISNGCREDAISVIRQQPLVYLNSVKTAIRRFFSSAVAYPPFLENLVVMAPLYRLGEMTWSRPVAVATAYGGALMISIFGVWGALRKGRRDEAALGLWVAWTLLWVLVVGSLVEVGENHRFRFLVTPLVWLTLADACRRLTCRLTVRAAHL